MPAGRDTHPLDDESKFNTVIVAALFTLCVSARQPEPERLLAVERQIAFIRFAYALPVSNGNRFPPENACPVFALKDLQRSGDLSL
jgi:hypothetical protein